LMFTSPEIWSIRFQLRHQTMEGEASAHRAIQHRFTNTAPAYWDTLEFRRRLSLRRPLVVMLLCIQSVIPWARSRCPVIFSCTMRKMWSLFKAYGGSASSPPPKSLHPPKRERCTKAAGVIEPPAIYQAQRPGGVFSLTRATKQNPFL
jgi:hypothetical protein